MRHKSFKSDYSPCSVASKTRHLRLWAIQQLRGSNFSQFWPPTPLEWTEMDILHSIDPLCPWRDPLWAFCWPSTPSFCPRSYWMPPYKLQHSLAYYYIIPSSFIKILFQILLQVCGHYSKNNFAKKKAKKNFKNKIGVFNIKVTFQLIGMIFWPPWKIFN